MDDLTLIRRIFDLEGRVDALEGHGGLFEPANPVTDAKYIVEEAHSGLSGEILLGEEISSGAFGSLPAAAAAGKLYLPTSGYYLLRDGGSAWAHWGPIWPLTLPNDADFSWYSQGSSTVSSANGAVYLTQGGGGWHGRMIAVPARPYTITALIHPNLNTNNNCAAGLFWKNGVDNKIVNFWFGWQAGWYLRAEKWSDSITYVTYYQSMVSPIQNGPLWLRVTEDNTNRICYWSVDGVNFIQFHSVARTDYITAGNVGWIVNNLSATFGLGAALLSWSQT
jgi:hypothetical protein